jgi:hypothetical protein
MLAHLYKRAEPDGLTFATFNTSLIVQRALGDPKTRLDFRMVRRVHLSRMHVYLNHRAGNETDIGPRWRNSE